MSNLPLDIGRQASGRYVLLEIFQRSIKIGRHAEQPFAALPHLLALAAHDNIAVKISGACTLSHEPFPYKDLWDPLGRVFDAFGFNRCMWGTDWTRAVGLLTYEQGVEAFRVTDRLSDSERAALMGDPFAPSVSIFRTDPFMTSTS